MKVLKEVMRRCAPVLLCALLCLSGPARADELSDRRLDLEEVRTTREQAAGNQTFDEDLRTAILELLDVAISALEAVALDVEQAEAFKRERDGVGRLVEVLQADLHRPQPPPTLRLPEDADAKRAEDVLARERARLSAHRSALRDVERLAEERASERNEISRRLGELDQQMDALGDELRAVAQRTMHPEQSAAARTSVLALREAAAARVERLRSESALLDARGVLIPGEIDQAKRRVTRSEKVVDLLVQAARELRQREAAESLEQVHARCREASEISPSVASLAAETEQLAEMLWGARGVVMLGEEITNARLTTGKHRDDLDRIAQLTRRKFEAFGYRGSIARWWPQTPQDFPKPGDVAKHLRELRRRLPEVQHELIRFEQQRSAVGEIGERIMLGEGVGEGLTEDERLEAIELLAVRRELLDELIQRYGRYSNKLVELQTVLTYLFNDLEAIQSFLYERLLWGRSVPRPIVPRLVDMKAAFIWLSSWSEWRTAAGTILGRLPGSGVLVALVFGLLLERRRWIRRRLAALGRRVNDPDRDSFGSTVEALLHTCLLAAPLPLALYLASGLLLQAEVSTYLFTAASAMYHVAFIAGLLEITRHLLAPGGLGEAHFGWSSRITHPVHRGLSWPVIAFLPLIYVAIHFVMAGLRLTSPPDLQLYNNALGRGAFVVAMFVLALPLLRMFRPNRWTRWREPGEELTPRHRLFVFGYPVIVIATVVPAVLALLGYYVTGLLLAYQMLRSLWLVAVLIILTGLMFRWRTLNRRKIAVAGGQVDAAEMPLTPSSAESQVRRLFRFVFTLVAVVGLYTIWADALPTLQIMKRIQIWPRVTLLESQDPRGLVLSAPAGTPGTPGEAAKAEGGSAAAAIPGVPVPVGPGSGQSAQASPDSSPLTLWKLLESILTFALTIVLVRNIPGLLQLILKRRSTLDTGARIALGTLVRYAIMILGSIVAFGLLGISWGKVQWLAAALTFGLGFGLQEIVANFVSGLILLMERPVRVGDAVTIGTLQGRVSRIQIRATTVTLWDRSEMIVPNKEFITSKLVNWTLSDSQRRIDVPFRVAYGADLPKVKAILLEIARKHPEVLKEPEPQALLLDFGDDAIRFELRVFVDFGKGLATMDELHMTIDSEFRRHGIEFALPQLNIQIPRRTRPRTDPKPSEG